MSRKYLNKWNKIVSLCDLLKLPRNRHTKRLSEKILVSSTKKWSLNEIFMMYYDFDDNFFHFPAYDVTWKDIRLIPIIEIDRWKALPRKPLIKEK